MDARTEFYSRVREIDQLQRIHQLLGWDQQVCMPSGGAAGRGEQLALAARLIHQRKTDPQLAAAVERLKEHELSDADQVNLREVERELLRQRQLSEDFVSEITRLSSQTFEAWRAARPAGDFGAVQGLLGRLLKLKREEAEQVGYEEHPYDALLDVFEPGSRLSEVKPLLLRLADGLAELLPVLEERTAAVVPLLGEYSMADQERLCRRAVADIGYDFSGGRLDVAEHPFECNLGPGDVRITTRYNSRSFLSALCTTLHEGGHALYEQGLPSEHAGTPLGSAVSMGIHESQSRLWENLIGRSRAYAEYLTQRAPEFFPECACARSSDRIWQQLNKVSASLIRVEADEVSYSLHIVIRMLLEEALVTGELEAEGLPTAWSELYQRYLGVRPGSDREGVLQDVHWYAGMVGYFPSYALGNLYGAMFLNAARNSLPELERQTAAGEFGALGRWLRQEVHQRGRRHSAGELVQVVTGKELSEEPFLSYLRAKFDL